MSYKKLDDIRIELGLPTKGNHKPKVGDYTNISLHFKVTTDEAKAFLLKCNVLGISESLLARRLILESLTKS